ncbi:hypothetical protein CHS0354_008978 [Potamilus streckersoni]|uniref:Uncharacterized protein n=1 Tax=Potamilus streckersoni TaxID=2493646 RepID=A0AAE0THQ1_9BIVA|nr:hypothetical protein CHS0354_008978 [Potamilus streckersoni]
MVIWYHGTKLEGECMVEDSTLMRCYSPQVNSSNGNCSTNSTMNESYSYGFVLDDVENVSNLTKKDKYIFETFSIVPDPSFQPLTSTFDSIYKHDPNSDLIITVSIL